MTRKLFALSSTLLFIIVAACSSDDPKTCPTGDPALCRGGTPTESCCENNGVACRINRGFSTVAPDGCTRVDYHCVPVGSAGASCDVDYCCPRTP
jgi:hypothetical protein